MSAIVFFDGTDEHIVDLDDHLRAQFGPYDWVESIPLYTTIAGDTALTIIRVTHKDRTRHQLYAITEHTWTLTAIYGNYTDALSELLRWRRYLNSGGTVAAWLHTHGDAIRPERSGFPVQRRCAPESAKNAENPRSPMQPFAVTAISNSKNRSLLDRKTAGQAQFSVGMPVSKTSPAAASSGPNAAQPSLLHSAHAGAQFPVSYSRCGAVTTGTTW